MDSLDGAAASCGGAYLRPGSVVAGFVLGAADGVSSRQLAEAVDAARASPEGLVSPGFQAQFGVTGVEVWMEELSAPPDPPDPPPPSPEPPSPEPPSPEPPSPDPPSPDPPSPEPPSPDPPAPDPPSPEPSPDPPSPDPPSPSPPPPPPPPPVPLNSYILTVNAAPGSGASCERIKASIASIAQAAAVQVPIVGCRNVTVLYNARVPVYAATAGFTSLDDADAGLAALQRSMSAFVLATGVGCGGTVLTAGVDKIDIFICGGGAAGSPFGGGVSVPELCCPPPPPLPPSPSPPPPPSPLPPGPSPPPPPSPRPPGPSPPSPRPPSPAPPSPAPSPAPPSPDPPGPSPDPPSPLPPSLPPPPSPSPPAPSPLPPHPSPKPPRAPPPLPQPQPPEVQEGALQSTTPPAPSTPGPVTNAPGASAGASIGPIVVAAIVPVAVLIALAGAVHWYNRRRYFDRALSDLMSVQVDERQAPDAVSVDGSRDSMDLPRSRTSHSSGV